MLQVQRSGNASLESLLPVADKTMNAYISSVDPLYNKMDLSLWQFHAAENMFTKHSRGLFTNVTDRQTQTIDSCH